MSRPRKPGLDYFALDADYYNDRKIKSLRRKCGDSGEATYTYILALIYGDKGYYIEYNDDLITDIANDRNHDESEIVFYINSMLDTGLFDRDKFDKYKILTSPRIVEFFKDVDKRSGRCNRLRIISDYDYNNNSDDVTTPKREETTPKREETTPKREETTLKREETTLKSQFSTQSKVNKIKLNTKSQSLSSTARESDSKISDEEATAAAENPIQNFYDSAKEVPTAMTTQKNQASNRIHLDPELNAAIGARRGSFLALLEEIGIKFHLMDGRLMVNELGALVRLLDIPGSVDGVELVRQGLQRLDKAKYITSGRFSNFNASLFLRHDIFIKLINGAYDNIIDVNKNCNRRSERQGKIIEGTDYSGWKDL